MLKLKLNGALLRFLEAIRLLPERILRLLGHIMQGINGIAHSSGHALPINRFLQWWIEFGFMILDLLAIPEWYETIMDFSKWKTRPLNGRERQVAGSVFGDTLLYDRIRVDERANIACKEHGIYYVSFFTINGWGALRDDIFIHELVHVWQFQLIGSVYIPRALLAQKTQMGYSYGGISALAKARKQGLGLSFFNLEQQADIISDYYCLRNGLMPRWASPIDFKSISDYEYFIEKIKAKNMN